MTELRVFPGGYKEGVWQHDRNMPDIEIAAGNGAWLRLALGTGKPGWLKLIWPLRGKPQLRRIK